MYETYIHRPDVYSKKVATKMRYDGELAMWRWSWSRMDAVRSKDGADSRRQPVTDRNCREIEGDLN